MASKNKALPLPRKTAIFLRKVAEYAHRQGVSVVFSIFERGTPLKWGYIGDTLRVRLDVVIPVLLRQ